MLCGHCCHKQRAEQLLLSPCPVPTTEPCLHSCSSLSPCTDQNRALFTQLLLSPVPTTEPCLHSCSSLSPPVLTKTELCLHSCSSPLSCPNNNRGLFTQLLLSPVLSQQQSLVYTVPPLPCPVPTEPCLHSCFSLSPCPDPTEPCLHSCSSLSPNRGMFTLGTVQPLPATQFPIPQLNLSGRAPPTCVNRALKRSLH